MLHFPSSSQVRWDPSPTTIYFKTDLYKVTIYLQVLLSLVCKEIYLSPEWQLKLLITRCGSCDGYRPSSQMSSVIYAPDDASSTGPVREIKGTDAACIEMKWSHQFLWQIQAPAHECNVNYWMANYYKNLLFLWFVRQFFQQRFPGLSWLIPQCCHHPII